MPQDQLQKSFLWKNGEFPTLIDLGGLEPDIPSSYARDINDNGQVVGSSTVLLEDGSCCLMRGFIWDSENNMRSLTDLVNYQGDLIITNAIAINNKGQILAAGIEGSEASGKPFLLTPDTEKPISVDVKPNTCPNEININKKGNTPIAILGSYDIEINQIDSDSVSILGVKPVRYSFEDIATPYNGELTNCGHCTTLEEDGFLDLVMHFDTQELVEAMEANGSIQDGDCFYLGVEAYMTEEYGGGKLVGKDVILIIDPK